MKRIILYAKHLISFGLVFLIASISANSFAQVTVDGYASVGIGAANANSINFTHTTGVGSNRLMLVGVSWNSGATTRSISSITFTPSGGNALPLTMIYTQETTNTSRFSSIYGLLSPPFETSGAITITFSGNVPYGIVAGAANFAGVDQTSPLDSPIGANGSGISPTLTLTGLTGNELIFDNVFQGAGNISQTLTVVSGQSELWNGYSVYTRASSSTKQAAGSSSVTMSWTAAQSTVWAIAAVPINPAPTYFDLTANSDINGIITLDPDGGNYLSGTTVTLTPVAGEGYVFDHWSGANSDDIIYENSIYTILMDEDKSVYANFSLPASGSVTSTVTATDDTPNVGDQITASVYIDMSEADSPDDYLGSYSGTLSWNTSVLQYVSHSEAPPTGYTGSVNTDNTAGGVIAFNGESSTASTDNIIIITITFNVTGPGSSPLDISYSSMASTVPKGLIQILTVTDGQITASEPPTCGIVQDGTSSVATGNAVSTLTFSHTTGTAEDRLFLVGVSWNCDVTPQTISSVTFDSQTMNNVITQLGENADGDDRYSAIYSLIDPPAGTNGTITITFTGAINSGIVAGAVNFSGVDQDTPFGTTAGASSSSGDSPSITLTGLNGNELIFDNVYKGIGDESQTITAVTGQTEVWNAADTYTRAASSYKQADGTSAIMSWTSDASTAWAIAAVPINPAFTNTWLGETSTDWNDGSNWCSGVPDETSDVLISAYPANQPVISGSVTALAASVTINPGASITIDPTGKATFTSIINNGTLNLNSSSAGTASLIVDACTGNNATIGLYLSPNYWHYISSPTNPGLSSDDLAAGNDLARFDEALPSVEPQTWQRGWVAWDGWSYLTGDYTGGYQGFSTLERGRGYNYWNASGYTFTFLGQINTSDPSPSISYAGDELWSGYNLLGNPYSCGINIQTMFNDASWTSALKSVYFTVNDVSYVVSDGGVSVPSGASLSIPPMQGFFVKAIGTGNIPFLASARQHSSTPRYKGEQAASIPLVRLSVNENSKSGETVIRFNEKATAGLDVEFDAPKFMDSPGTPSISTTLDGKDFAINGLPFPETSVEIPVTLNLLVDGNHTINAMEILELTNYSVTLKDLLTSSTIDLKSASEYSFTAEAGSLKGRFILAITNMTTDIEDLVKPADAFNIYYGFDLINIQPVSDDWDGKTGTVKILDFSGKPVRYQNNAEFNNNTLVQIPAPERSGLYFVEIRSGMMKFVGKIVVK